MSDLFKQPNADPPARPVGGDIGPTHVPRLSREQAQGRRSVLRGLWALAQFATAAASATLAACLDRRTPPVGPAGAPSLGSHQLVFSRDGVAVTPLSTAGMTTEATGSTILVCVGRGEVVTHARPSDSKGNGYLQRDRRHVYTLWPKSGTALYACLRAAGGPGHVVTSPKCVAADETTLSVVELVNAGVVQQIAWNETLAGKPTTSRSVTTTGPAMLVAWWWGDADVHFEKTAVPSDGFAMIDSILLEGALVQCAVAVRQVNGPGTYQVTWTATPAQGAQLWVVAVQSAG